MELFLQKMGEVAVCIDQAKRRATALRCEAMLLDAHPEFGPHYQSPLVWLQLAARSGKSWRDETEKDQVEARLAVIRHAAAVMRAKGVPLTKIGTDFDFGFEVEIAGQKIRMTVPSESTCSYVETGEFEEIEEPIVSGTRTVRKPVRKRVCARLIGDEVPL